MRPFLERVAITGADDKIDQSDLFAISEEFPFVEWGILLSKSSEGSIRYPSYAWLLKLFYLWEHSNSSIQLSGHICGQWVRDICRGHWSFLVDCEDIHPMFSRLQLNFHAQVHDLNKKAFLKGFDNPQLYFKQYIFQMDNINNLILNLAQADDVDAVPLFDLSGGRGILPDTWPTATGYAGYSGGLSIDNIKEALPAIEVAANGNLAWIDIETHIRSNNRAIFDLNKVRTFLELVSPWVLSVKNAAV